ncbi:rhamnan synthesis F family protein (plasmid) [Bartonella sp. HY329]|uniref:rhamnan synthesis F family protein n=1 Tax=unclassified Bartonella TaxID=2645622 RepID=UPI0021C796A3|nr:MULTISPECIES: rhamnan synthesis F family protein [unclassified Bartonella]UXM96511.1 rhamnan synthesis F family protein [Bartonella sp. HY329]UXN10834.1 rhamnan synthesis F family protein [Bartonella sp. HY328]
MFFSIKDVIINLLSPKKRRLPWGFNSKIYRYLYNDIDNYGKKPRQHYRNIGMKEGRLYKKSAFVKKTSLNPNLETIVVCCDDENESLFFIDAVKKLSKTFNIILVANSYHLNDIYLPYCNWLIVNKIFDRKKKYASELIKEFATAPNLKFIVSNIYEGGIFYQRLEKAKIASVLIIGNTLAFGKSNLSRGLCTATRVIYTDKTYAEKVLYDYMYGFPDQLTILSAPAHHVGFAAEKINTKIVIGYGDVSFTDGFDVFTKISSLYKLQYPHDKTEFIWLRALNNGSNSSRFEQTQTWSQISKADQSYRILSTKSFNDNYYQKSAVFFDTSRLVNKICHAKSALQAGKPVFALDGVMPLSARYQEENIDEQYLLSQTNDQEFISKLHEHLIAADKTNKDQLDAISTKLGSVDQFVDELLDIGGKAARQIKQEAIDAIELFGKKEFDNSFWTANSLKPFSVKRARQYIRGWKSGVYPRRPCAGFQPGIYAEYHDLGLERKDAFLHYLNAGQPDGPWQWDILTKPIKIEPTALTQKIALQIHAYYIEKLEVMLNALLANEVRPDLFISVKNEADKQIAEYLLKNYPAKVEVLVTENRGRDIGPLLTLFRQQLRNGYDIIGHMHSKTSVHIKDRSYAEIWGQYLTMNLLGDGATIKAADTIIQTMYNDKNINLVFPDDRNGISWAKNRPAAQKLAPRLGIDKLPNYINFPVGTMFWATSDLMKPFFDLELEWNDYLSEPLPLDGTNLHAVERLFGVMNQKISKKLVCTMFGDIKR